MKQLLFLLLFPCLALAQYPGNAGQKITLGEQTTADGLVYRGVAADTALIKPFRDTMAYIILDTNTNIIWQYKKATNNAWTCRLNLFIPIQRLLIMQQRELIGHTNGGKWWNS
jgi:hypothetical protein